MVQRVYAKGTLLESVDAASATEKYRFDVYALGDDLFIFPQMRCLLDRTLTHAQRLIVLAQRRDLGAGRKGMLLAACVGHFGTVLAPLFSGAFGKRYMGLPRKKRSDVVAHRVAFGRLSAEGIEFLQRDTLFECLSVADEWLCDKMGFGLDEVVFGDRTPEAVATLEKKGQLWRIRPQVYALSEIEAWVARSWQGIETEVRYCVSLSGVYWLTYDAFMRIIPLARKNPAVGLACVREWVAMAPGYQRSAMRRERGSGRSVIAFFGVSQEVAEKLFIPALERLLEGMTLGQITANDVADVLTGIGILFLHALQDPVFADSQAERTVLALYGRILDGGNSTGAQVDFDARRVALPGVTVAEGGELVEHPGIDAQTRNAVHHLVQRLSQGESLDYVNVYEIRSTKNLASKSGQSREIVFKTDRNPVPVSYVQKRLGSVNAGYSDYLLARANVFRALGADYPAFQLITKDTHGKRRQETPYFLRTRCPGDPLSALAPALFRAVPENPQSAELPDVVLGVATLYGSAAAQNLAVKKFVATPEATCRFGIDKEIFAFVYNASKHRLMPESVQVCSIRGTLGWRTIACDEENLRDAHRFYLKAYASAMGDFWHTHAEACTLNECASAFFDGFERKMESMYWVYQQNREDFDTFAPRLKPVYCFRERLDFALWALEREASELPALREKFMDYVRDAFIKV